MSVRESKLSSRGGGPRPKAKEPPGSPRVAPCASAMISSSREERGTSRGGGAAGGPTEKRGLDRDRTTGATVGKPTQARSRSQVVIHVRHAVIRVGEEKGSQRWTSTTRRLARCQLKIRGPDRGIRRSRRRSGSRSESIVSPGSTRPASDWAIDRSSSARPRRFRSGLVPMRVRPGWLRGRL